MTTCQTWKWFGNSPPTSELRRLLSPLWVHRYTSRLPWALGGCLGMWELGIWAQPDRDHIQTSQVIIKVRHALTCNSRCHRTFSPEPPDASFKALLHLSSLADANPTFLLLGLLHYSADYVTLLISAHDQPWPALFFVPTNSIKGNI